MVKMKQKEGKTYNEEKKKAKYQMEYHENFGNWISECDFFRSATFMAAGM